MNETDVRELAPPIHGQADPAECRHDCVAETLPQVKAPIRILPHTGDTVCSIWLA